MILLFDSNTKKKMFRLLSFVPLVSALLSTVQTTPCNSTNDTSISPLPQIKVMHGEVTYFNQKYFNVYDLKIIKHNATYNDVEMDINLIKDLPVDFYLYFTLYLTDENYNNRKYLLKDSVPICAVSPDHDMLPLAALYADEIPRTACFKKGLYKFSDVGHFKFEMMFPDIHKISDYQLSVYTYYADHELISNITLYSEWGYLHRQ